MTHILNKTQLRIIAFTIIYTVGFYAWFVYNGNGEFVWYLLQFFAFIMVVCIALSRMPDFPTSLLLSMSLVGLLHVAGGGVTINNTPLYSYPLAMLYNGPSPDFFILKYDQVIHFLGFGLVALILRYILLRYAPTILRFPRALFAGFAALGLGALNEISEFVAVLAFTRTGVGGYFNLALDLSFNLLGIIVAMIGAELFSSLKNRKKEKSVI